MDITGGITVMALKLHDPIKRQDNMSKSSPNKYINSSLFKKSLSLFE